MRDQSHGQLLPAASTRAIERRNNLASERFGRGKRFHPIETKAVSDSFQSKQTQHIYICTKRGQRFVCRFYNFHPPLNSSTGGILILLWKITNKGFLFVKEINFSLGDFYRAPYLNLYSGSRNRSRDRGKWKSRSWQLFRKAAAKGGRVCMENQRETISRTLRDPLATAHASHGPTLKPALLGASYVYDAYLWIVVMVDDDVTVVAVLKVPLLLSGHHRLNVIQYFVVDFEKVFWNKVFSFLSFLRSS